MPPKKAKDYYHEELERRQKRARKKRNVLMDHNRADVNVTMMTGVTDYQCNTAINERKDSEFSDQIIEELKYRQKYEDSLKVIIEKRKEKSKKEPTEWLKRVAIFGERLASRLYLTINLDGSDTIPHNISSFAPPSYPLTKDLQSDIIINTFGL